MRSFFLAAKFPAAGSNPAPECASFPLGMAIPRCAAVFFAGSKSASHAGRLRNDLAPKIRRLQSPIRGIETFARYGRGASLREKERVGHDPFRLFREIRVSGLLLDLASSLPYRPVIISRIAWTRPFFQPEYWMPPRGGEARVLLTETLVRWHRA